MFHDRSRYQPSSTYQLAPFRFGRLEGDRYIVTNDVGEYVVLSREELAAFASHKLSPELASLCT